MADQFNTPEGERIGTTPQAVPGREADLHESAGFNEGAGLSAEEAGREEDLDEGAATWGKDLLDWVTATIRERPLETLLVVAGASLVTGVVAGTFIKTSDK